MGFLYSRGVFCIFLSFCVSDGLFWVCLFVSDLLGSGCSMFYCCTVLKFNFLAFWVGVCLSDCAWMFLGLV